MGIGGTRIIGLSKRSEQLIVAISDRNSSSGRDQSPVVEPILVVRSDQPLEGVFVEEIVDALDALARKHLRRRWRTAAAPRIRTRDLRLLRKTEPRPVLMCDLPVQRRMDHVEDVPELDRGWSARRGCVPIIVKRKVNRPLRDPVVRDAHAGDGRVRRGVAELVGGKHGGLAGADPAEGSEGLGGEVKVEVGARGFAVEEGVDLEGGRGVGPGGGIPGAEPPAKGASALLV